MGRLLLLAGMKNFILYCTVAFGLGCYEGFSQDARVRIDTDVVLSVKEVFHLIESQTDYEFIYRPALLEGASPVKIARGEMRTGDLLDKILAPEYFSYEFYNNTIIVREKEGISGVTTAAQTVDIRGTVTDSKGNPLPGVTVLVKGGENGVVTDFDGNYHIEFVAGGGLSFSFMGFTPREVVVEAGSSVIDVQLEESVTALEEVVLASTGYQTISRERATGAFVSVAKEQLEKPASSVAERLVGVVPGLQSTVGAYGLVNFRVRGQSSLLADAQPLVVYDGFPVEGGLESINPNDVESITVLKDAAAASIWGAKSANGVIVVTSKQSKQGKLRVSVSSFVKTSGKLDLGYVNPIATGAEVIDYEQKGFDTDLFGGGSNPLPPAMFIVYPQSLAVTAMNEARLGRITPEDRDATLARLRGLNNQKQIRDYLLETPITQQYNVAVSGGGEHIANTLSILLEDRKTFFKGDEQERVLINYKNQTDLKDWLTFDFSGMLGYEKVKTNGVDLNFIHDLQPYDMLVNADGSLTDMSYLHYYMPNMEAFVPMDKFPYPDWSYNPISEIRNRDRTLTGLNSRFQAGLTFKMLEGLMFSPRIQYELFNTRGRSYYVEESFTVRNYINTTSRWNQDYDTSPVANIPKGGFLAQSKIRVRAYSFRNQLSFDRTLGEKHNINFIAGSEISDRVREFTQNPLAYGYNEKTRTIVESLTPSDKLVDWGGNSFRIPTAHGFQYDTDRYFSLYGNLGYTFDDRYTVTGSYRTDASNLISDDPEYRYSPFWSVGLGWQLGREGFMDKREWIDRLNLRLTYGYNGNVDKSTSFLPLININAEPDLYTGENTAGISDYGNPTLRWERTRTVNWGLDFSFFGRKLYGTLDLYDRKSTDLIALQSIPSVHGTDRQKLNSATMSNRGFEISLGTVLPIKGEDIVWSGSVNYSYNNNKITELYKNFYFASELSQGVTEAYVKGYDASTLWSYRYAGMVNTGTVSAPHLLPSFYGPDNEKFSFQNLPPGDGRQYLFDQGTRVAPRTLGLISSLKVYDFDFSFIITARFGHVFRRHGFNYHPMGDGNVTHVNKRYREVLDSDPSEVVPVPVDAEGQYFMWGEFTPYLDYLTVNASHIRFREISLGYSLPKNVRAKLGVYTLRFFAQANHVGGIFFNDYGEDPEYPMGNLKPQPVFTFGLDFSF
ncbi:SusC/RagA family TonB-linked outer membrane protein [Sinomicrobium pectinilyticum]|uniref:SusC/RagA family TonB-linked outer membrane protein n=1 Tax=Sinomicrobium pectinilyticum TaxID=1084421 RepID=A0A3N0CZH1_SINP1|nr:SusC/RagA family TonB-linked outer membrane protein [Sinomicrobium pectinilyticum]RNL68596.1 SusC/RagA family TonB-linked outer membrane protein [Sinomicrobium pectinilyticum]